MKKLVSLVVMVAFLSCVCLPGYAVDPKAKEGFESRQETVKKKQARFPWIATVFIVSASVVVAMIVTTMIKADAYDQRTEALSRM